MGSWDNGLDSVTSLRAEGGFDNRKPSSRRVPDGQFCLTAKGKSRTVKNFP
jgi:hypothetical protein